MKREGFNMYTKIGAFILVIAFVIAGSAQTDANADNAKDAAADSGKAAPGMNRAGEVIDASKVESGHGQKVKGINDYEGEITGIPAPNSKFTQLQIGMGMKQGTDIAGQ